MLKLLFPHKTTEVQYSMLLLLLRLLLGGLFLIHGLDKLTAFDELQHSFFDPLGISSRSSLILAIFGELICASGFIVGLFTRLALIPMITTMVVAHFMVPGVNASGQELSLIYMSIFTILFFSGPGNYSFDYLIGNAINKKNNRSRLRNPRR